MKNYNGKIPFATSNLACSALFLLHLNSFGLKFWVSYCFYVFSTNVSHQNVIKLPVLFLASIVLLFLQDCLCQLAEIEVNHETTNNCRK